MAQNIGNLAVTLALDAVAFARGLDKGDKGLKKFAAAAAKTMAAVSAAEVGFGAIKAPFDWVGEGIDKVADVGREAQRLGVSTEKLSALQFAAGRDADAWEMGLRRLGMSLGAAGMGSAEAATKFRAFGLDGKELADMGLDKAIGKIADKFKSMQDAGARAKLAEELFGRESAALIPILMKGSAGFAEADAAAKKLGLSVSSIDAAKAFTAQRAMDDLGKAFEGLQRMAAVEFAPLVTSISTNLTDMIAKAGGGKELFKGMADSFSGFLINVLTTVEGIAVGLADAAQQVKGILDKLPWAKRGGEKDDGEPHLKPKYPLPQLPKPFWGAPDAEEDEESWGGKVKSGFDVLIKGIMNRNKALKDSIDAFKDLGKAGGAGPNAELDEKVRLLTVSLKSQVSAYGLVGDAAQRYSLASLGATDAQLAGIDASIKELTALKNITEGTGAGLNIFQESASQVNKLTDAMHAGIVSADGFTAGYKKLQEQLAMKVDAEALKVFQDTASPLEKFKASVAEMDQLLAMGKISAKQYAAEVAKDWEGIGKTMEEVHHAGAMEEGSKEAYSAILHEQDRDNRPADMQQRMVAILEQLTKQQALAEKTNQQIADAINRIFKKGA